MLQNNLLSKFFRTTFSALLVCAGISYLATFSAHAATASQFEASAAATVNDCFGSASISGTVVDMNGEPAPDFLVAINRSPDTDHVSIATICDSTVSDELGAFMIEGIAAGEFFLQVFPIQQGQGPDQIYAPPPRAVTLIEDEAMVLEQPLLLEQAQGFVQVVFSGDDSPLIGDVIIVRRHSEETECPSGIYDTFNGDSRVIETNGIAYWGSKYPGTYCMMASATPESTSGQWPTNIAATHSAPIMFEIAAGAQMVDFGTIDLTLPSKRIIGSIATADKTGIPDILVTAQNRDTYEYLEATSDADGYFEFIVDGGEWEVEFEINRSIGYLAQSTYTVSFGTDETEIITVIIDPVKTIDSAFTGRLLDVDGELLDEWGAVFVRVDNIETDFVKYGDIDESGRFNLPVWDGTYEVRIEVDSIIDTPLFAPIPFTMTIEAGETVDLGDILMGTPQATGSLVGPDGLAPIEAVYQLYGPYSDGEVATLDCSTELVDPDTDDPLLPYSFGEIQQGDPLQIGGLLTGNYCLHLNFRAQFGGSLPLFTTTTFSLADENSVVDLGTIRAPASPESPKRLVGSVILPDGVGIEGIRVSAVKIEDGDVESFPLFVGDFAAAMTDATGAYVLNLDSGKWRVAVTLNETALEIAPRLFSQDAEQIVILADDENRETQTLDFVVMEQNATISGTLLKPDGTPAIGVSASVHANSEQFNSSWVSAMVDPETAQFELDVVGGFWQVGYYLIDNYGDNSEDGGNYVDSVIPLSVTVEANSDAQQDFMLLEYDAMLRGTLLNPDGSPVESGQVLVTWLDQTDHPLARYADIYRSVRVVNGQFEINVLSGVEYEITVNNSSIFVPPSTQRLTLSANGTADIQLQFSKPDATISGRTHFTDLGIPPAYAEISAYSTNGEHFVIQTDVEGAFSLPVKSGSTWHLTASWAAQSNATTIYAAYGVAVQVEAPGDQEVALWLKPEAFELPILSQTTFEYSAAHSTRLADGTTITVPAGAVPVGDMAGDDVRMEVKPLVIGLPNSYSIDSVEYGYTIQLFNQHTGEEITNALSQDIVVTYRYTDEALTAMNADESTLIPAVRGAGTTAWESTANFSVDLQKNEVTISIRQASDAALIVRTTREQLNRSEFSFIPLMFR